MKERGPAIPSNRDQARSRRKRDIRARTVSLKSMGLRDLRNAALVPTPPHERPTTRGACEGGERPCPFVSCKWHLYLEVNERNGSIKLRFPDLEPDELPETCAIDVARSGGATLERTGELMNITREAVRLIEEGAVRKLRRLPLFQRMHAELGDSWMWRGAA